MPIDRSVGKEDVVHINYVLLLSHKKNEIMNICSNMHEPRDYRTK